jgi:hypothetical protein
MDRGRLNFGELIAGVSAFLLSYFMFFDWFGIELVNDSRSNLLGNLNLFQPAAGIAFGGFWAMLGKASP